MASIRKIKGGKWFAEVRLKGMSAVKEKEFCRDVQEEAYEF